MQPAGAGIQYPTLPGRLEESTQQSLLLAFIISDLQDPSPSQILGAFSRFSEDFLGRERDPQGGSPRVREDPLGTPPLSLPRKSSENLEKVPRIWEGEGSRRSEIMNASNNDYWVRP